MLLCNIDISIWVYHLLGASQGALVVKNKKKKKTACQCRSHKRCGFDPWIRKIP